MTYQRQTVFEALERMKIKIQYFETEVVGSGKLNS